MGQLVNGVWQDTWYDTAAHGGKFVRDTSKFRNWITPDGAPAPRARAVSRRRAGAITSMSRSPAPGRIAR